MLYNVTKKTCPLKKGDITNFTGFVGGNFYERFFNQEIFRETRSDIVSMTSY